MKVVGGGYFEYWVRRGGGVSGVGILTCNKL